VHHRVYLALGRSDRDRQSAFRALCDEPLPEFELLCVRNNWVLPAPDTIALAGI